MTENEIVDMLFLLHKRISRSEFHVTQGEKWALVDATNIIRLQKAKIEKLKSENEILSRNADNAFQEGLNERRELFEPEIKAEAYKELAERLENEINIRTTLSRAQDKNVIHIIHKRHKIKEADKE